MEVIASRSLNSIYIILDCIFLLTFTAVLVYARRYLALLAGLAGAVIYFLVDYGIFYLLLGTRTVSGANTFFFLLWLSLSYGLTNFAWIWLWLDNKGHKLEWSLFIISGWFATALLSKSYGASFPIISISRGTADYHGIFALLLFIGYALLIIHNLKVKEKARKINIGQILAIGVLVQGSWELVLLITGIRPQGIMPLVINSLLETNMGLPYLFFIHRAVTGRFRKEM